jgi:hypothetical protein
MDALEAAKAAGFLCHRYVTADRPGIRGVTRGSGFSYIRVDGKPLTDETELARTSRWSAAKSQPVSARSRLGPNAIT